MLNISEFFLPLLRQLTFYFKKTWTIGRWRDRRLPATPRLLVIEMGKMHTNGDYGVLFLFSKAHVYLHTKFVWKKCKEWEKKSLKRLSNSACLRIRGHPLHEMSVTFRLSVSESCKKKNSDSAFKFCQKVLGGREFQTLLDNVWSTLSLSLLELI